MVVLAGAVRALSFIYRPMHAVRCSPRLAAALLVMFGVAGCDLLRELVPPRIDGEWEADEAEWTLADRSVTRMSVRMSLAGTSPVGDAAYVQVVGDGEAVRDSGSEPFNVLGTQENTDVSLTLVGVEPLGFLLTCRFASMTEITCTSRSDARVNRVRFRRL